MTAKKNQLNASQTRMERVQVGQKLVISNDFLIKFYLSDRNSKHVSIVHNVLYLFSQWQKYWQMMMMINIKKDTMQISQPENTKPYSSWTHPSAERNQCTPETLFNLLLLIWLGSNICETHDFGIKCTVSERKRWSVFEEFSLARLQAQLPFLTILLSHMVFFYYNGIE